MRHKKRNPPPQPSKPPQPRKPATAHGGGGESQNVVDPNGGGAPPPLPQETDPLDPTSATYSSIREECREAIAPLKKSHHDPKALRKIKDICQTHPNSALAHAVLANVHHRAASVMAGPEKQRHLRAAFESARRSTALSPNAIGFAANYAALLFKTSCHEEAVRECHRALSIVDPIDPALEELEDETQSGRKSTKEARIERLKNVLRYLPQKFDGSRPILPNPPAVIEPPDGKAVEEMRGKLLAQQAAQGILRAHSDWILSPLKTDDSGGDEGQGVVDVNNPQNLKVQKHYRQVLMDRVMKLSKKVTDSESYWTLLSEEEKKELLQLSIEDLRKHLDSLKDMGGSAAKTLSKAIDFAQKNKAWKAFSCSFCDDDDDDEKFLCFKSLIKHLHKEHKSDAALHFLVFGPQDEEADGDADVSKFELLDIKKRIVFTRDQSCLLLEDYFRDDEADVQESADSDALMHWLFGGFTMGEEWESWVVQQDDAKCKGKVAFEIFLEEYGLYQRLSDARLGLATQMGAYNNLKVVCDEELEKRSKGIVRQSYESLLRQMQQQLEQDNDAIPGVLKEAKALNDKEPDACIRLAIQRALERQSAELSNLKGLIERTGNMLREEWNKYKQASRIDYRTIILPFLKSFIQSKLERLVYEDAERKADAAREALLSELELDAKKNASQRGGSVKPPKGDPKGKRQKKDKRKAKDDKEKAKDPKEIMLQEEYFANQKIAEDDVKRKALAKQNKNAATLTPKERDKVVVVWPTARDDEGLDGSNVVQEERKLQEKLAHQKMVEKEAKRKAVTKQTKSAATPTPKEMNKKVVDWSPASEDEGLEGSIEKDVAASHHQVPPSVPTQSVDQHDASQACWDSSSEEKKEELLQFSIGDLSEHLGSLTDGAGFTAKIFSEAIRFAQNNKTWKVFACSFCKDEKFVDLNSLLNHLQMIHDSFSAHDFLHFVPQEEEDDADVSEFELLDIKKRIVFSSDQSCLILEDHFRNVEEDDEQKPADSNALTHWLYCGSTIAEELEILWGGGHDEAKQKGKEAFEMFEHQYAIYQDMCEERLGLESKKEALKLKEAKALNENQPDVVQREIEQAIQREIERQSAKLSNLEEMITKIDTSLRVVGKTYKQISSIDYRAIMLPCLKSFMQSKLEPLVYKYAKQKADAKRKADANRKRDAAGEAHFPTVAITADELKLQIEHGEEEIRRIEEEFERLEEEDRKLEALSENPQWIEEEAKNAAATVLEKMTKTVVDRSRASIDKGPDGGYKLLAKTTDELKQQIESDEEIRRIDEEVERLEEVNRMFEAMLENPQLIEEEAKNAAATILEKMLTTVV